MLKAGSAVIAQKPGQAYSPAAEAADPQRLQPEYISSFLKGAAGLLFSVETRKAHGNSKRSV